MVEVMKIMWTSFKRSHSCGATLSVPNPRAGPCLCQRLLDTPSQVWVISCGVTAPFSWVLVHKGFACAFQESVSPVLCKFWWLNGGANGDLLQEGLCHNQVYCTQSPCPCNSPLLTCTSAGDTQTQFWLILCGVSRSWCAQGLSEPSKCLWWVWALTLNVISPLLPSCWSSHHSQ